MATVGYHIDQNVPVFPSPVQVGENTIILPIENSSDFYYPNSIKRLGDFSMEVLRERPITIMDLIHDVFPKNQFYDNHEWYHKTFEIFEVGSIDVFSPSLTLTPDNYYWKFFANKSYGVSNQFSPLSGPYSHQINSLAYELHWIPDTILYINHRYADNDKYGYYMKYRIIDPGEQTHEYYLLRVYSMNGIKRNWTGNLKSDFKISYLPYIGPMKYNDIIEHGEYALDAAVGSYPLQVSVLESVFPITTFVRNFNPVLINQYDGKSIYRVYFLGTNQGGTSDLPIYSIENLPALQYSMNTIFNNSSVRFDQLSAGMVTLNGNLLSVDIDQVKIKIAVEDPWSGMLWTQEI